MTTPRSSPGRAAVPTPVLHPALLARVQQLNQHYLQLLRVESAHPEGGSQWSQLLPECSGLLRLSPPMEARLCAAPYPLYSLGFEHPRLWPAACEATPPEGWSPMVHDDGQALDARRSFFELAVLHAWHVAVTHPVAARVVYGMGEATLQAFGKVALPRVVLAAGMQCEVLAPRWPGNPVFWPDLIRFARGGDMRRLAVTHLLGAQLIAAELELLSLSDDISASANVQRAAMSPRLRERHSRLALRLGAGCAAVGQGARGGLRIVSSNRSSSRRTQ